MISDGYYTSKKSDDICEDVCGQQASPTFLSMSRLRCFLLGLDFKAIVFLFLIVPTFIVGIYFHGQKITYFLRPLWQSPPKPFISITHYYHENVSMETLCKLHGWGIREYPRRVYDAVLFSNEVDMLMIRWKELYPYITQFVLLESNSTFTALPKPLNFAINRDKFKFVEPRLTYGKVGGRFRRGENPFIEEAYQRLALDQLLRIAGIEDDDLLIMSDVDEIPSRHTVDLLRWCNGIPPILHLQLRNYLYSFEFQYDHLSWRASVHRYQSGTTSLQPQRSGEVFAFPEPQKDSGSNLQRADLYDMLPEEYTFRDIIGKMGPIPHSYSAVHLPSYLLENADDYKYLLPGNCMREHG
ncbi:hypothetical protein Sango_1765300 [Sesamum angolense]|uniref:Uncharacterized protein n=1 Tax=Sesamum angolense TaxID=2727404 RepID=A0AAE2BPM2_9LAMI|nr:hypothetical protein Sango_1765300 [Sesamum angolense]